MVEKGKALPDKGQNIATRTAEIRLERKATNRRETRKSRALRMRERGYIYIYIERERERDR